MPTHDFGRLSSFDFEELVCDLLQAEWRTRMEIFTAGRDSGIDLRAFADRKNETIIQCKHVPGSTFSRLLSHLRREELQYILRDMQKRHRVSFRSALKKLDDHIRKRRGTEDNEEDDGYHPVAASTKKHEPDNEDEVRRLFGSLVA